MTPGLLVKARHTNVTFLPLIARLPVAPDLLGAVIPGANPIRQRDFANPVPFLQPPVVCRPFVPRS
jgi:hypothetical protein